MRDINAIAFTVKYVCIAYTYSRDQYAMHAHAHAQYVGTTPDSASETVGILIALIIIFRLLAYLFLTIKSNRSH